MGRTVNGNGTGGGSVIASGIPVEIQRALRTLESRISTLQAQVEQHSSQLDGKLGGSTADLVKLGGAMREQLQAAGTSPLSLSSLPGVAAQPQRASIPASSGVNTTVGPAGSVIFKNGQLYRSDGTKYIPVGSGGILTDTHANRLANYTASTYSIGTIFNETDRNTVYIVRSISGSNSWVYMAGVQNAVYASRPTDLGANDAGYLFYATDTNLLYEWSGSVFTAVSGSLTTGNLTEASSSVLTVTGGTGAVVGSGTTIQVKQSTGSVSGYLSSTDWTTFNGKQPNLGYTPLNAASNLSDLASATTARTNLGLGSAATQASSAFDAAGAASAAQTAAQTYASNASNLSSGTVAAARLPNPTATTLGGVESLAAVTSKWINTISTAGVPAATQPAFTDISGTVAAAQLPTPTATTLGGIESLGAATSKWLNAISTSGVPTATQPAFTDISGSVAATQLPNPSATTLGGIESLAAVTHQWISSISTSGVPSATQPAFFDISGVATAAQLPTTLAYTNGANVFTQTQTINGFGLRTGMLATGFRTVTTATDTVVAATDRTLVLNGVTTETLSAAPISGTEYYIVNIAAASASISGNGKNIWVAGTSAATYTLAANTGIVLVYDGTVWRGVAMALSYTPLNPANNLSEVTPATARTNLGLGSAAVQATAALTEATSAVLTITGGSNALVNAATIQVKQASGTQAGYLASADWTTFNGKQAAIGYTPLNPANNLSDLAAAATARTNLGLGTAATQASTAFDVAGAASGLLASSNTWAAAQIFSSSPRINGAAATDRYLAFSTAGSNRWILDLTSDAESGSNIGSNIKFSRYTDAGGYNGDAFTINRATGNVTLGGTITATGYTAGSSAGVSGTVTIPKLTTANGSITITNGIITAFTNPT